MQVGGSVYVAVNLIESALCVVLYHLIFTGALDEDIEVIFFHPILMRKEDIEPPMLSFHTKLVDCDCFTDITLSNVITL